MRIIRSPFRISFFGGSTDYESFYKKNESFIIGATINKYVYCSIRDIPKIGNKKTIVSYSITETVDNINEIKNNLIRETLKYHNIHKHSEIHLFSDIPSRTGLGGSSSFCVALSLTIRNFLDNPISKKILAKDAICIEREILKESGGIQDQIHSAYGGFNSIEINKDGEFFVKPIGITPEFKEEFHKSIILIYTNSQRYEDDIAKSHENKNKINILNLAKDAYAAFQKEDIKLIGNLMYESWNEKSKISNLISTDKINEIINDVIKIGAYGAKLLGSGGCGFVLVICNSHTKHIIKEKYKDSILDFEFEPNGVSEIYRS